MDRSFVKLTNWILAIIISLASPLSAAAQASAPGVLRVNPANRRYFTDGTGKSILLVGSHTWHNFLDGGLTDPPTPFNWSGYLNMLQASNHNFIRMFNWEHATWNTWTTGLYWFTPNPYSRTGPGNALDGKPKFNINSFNQAYFDRMRQRIVEAGQRGMFVSIMLFDGWSVEDKGRPGNPWRGHPFNANNNINGISGDANGDGQGGEVHRLVNSAVTAAQDAYVKKVIDTVNDLDNVLYEICNECDGSALAWENHMVNLIKSYEAGKPKQHPVGMTVEYPNGNNSDLFASQADWISPNPVGGYDTNPPAATGNKIIVNDTDHLCGAECGDRIWVWKSFTRGLNVLMMDGWGSSDYVSIAHPNLNINDPVYVSLRANMGHARSYADAMNLTAMTPRGDLTSTSYALASPNTATPEYLIYAPSGGSFTVNLTGNSGQFSVEWLNPSNGTKTAGAAGSGGAVRTFTSPFSGDAVLYLKQSTSSSDTQSPTVVISTPTPNVTFATSSNSLTLGGTASDNVGVTQVSWVNDRGGSGVASGTTSWSVTAVALQPGTNVLTVTARDAANNLGVDTLTVTYN